MTPKTFRLVTCKFLLLLPYRIIADGGDIGFSAMSVSREIQSISLSGCFAFLYFGCYNGSHCIPLVAVYAQLFCFFFFSFFFVQLLLRLISFDFFFFFNFFFCFVFCTVHNLCLCFSFRWNMITQILSLWFSPNLVIYFRFCSFTFTYSLWLSFTFIYVFFFSFFWTSPLWISAIFQLILNSFTHLNYWPPFQKYFCCNRDHEYQQNS